MALNYVDDGSDMVYYYVMDRLYGELCTCCTYDKIALGIVEFLVMHPIKIRVLFACTYVKISSGQRKQFL